MTKEPTERDMFVVIAARNGIDAWAAAELMELAAAHGRIQVRDCNENCDCREEEVKGSNPPRWEIVKLCRRHVREKNIQTRVEAICSEVPKKWRVRSKVYKGVVYKVGKRKGDVQRWLDRQLTLTGAKRRGGFGKDDAYLEKHGVVPIFGGDPRGYTVKLLLPDGTYNTWGGFECGLGVPQ